MFILRKITQNGLQWNHYLGKSYSFITEEKNPELFRETLDQVEFEDPEIYAVVFNDNGEALPLYTGQKNYIMSDSGKTFSNISYE